MGWFLAVAIYYVWVLVLYEYPHIPCYIFVAVVGCFEPLPQIHSRVKVLLVLHFFHFSFLHLGGSGGKIFTVVILV